jgi:sugar lactone lactonase YvrE
MNTQTSNEAVEAHRSHPSQYGIATIAGTPYDPSGDGGAATLAAISLSGVAFRNGELYLTDGTRIRRITEDGIITTVVGLLDPVVHQPIPGFSGDGGPALGAQLRGAVALEFDGAGNLYIADSGDSCVRKVTARLVAGVAQPIDGTEIISTFAGTGTVVGNSGDGGPAAGAMLNAPRGIAIDPGSGTLYIADQSNNNIRKVDAGGTITTIAGTGAPGFSDGPAAGATFHLPTGVTVDPGTGDVYVADVLNSRVRKISGGNVTTFAGTGTSSAVGNLNEGGAAIAANIRPVKVRFVNGILYIVDSGVGMIRLINIGTGIITTLVGSGLPVYAGAFPPIGDGGPALGGLLGSGPSGVQDSAFDGSGNLFITDASSRRVRFVASPSAAATIFGQTIAAGNIATVAGPPSVVTFSGDGGPAAAAILFQGGGITFDPNGNLYLSDSGNNRVRQITPPQQTSSPRTITTIAGSGTVGFSGVPGMATGANLQPGGLAFNTGSLYLTNNGTRIAEVAIGSITLVANPTGASTPVAPDGTDADAVKACLGVSAIVFDQAGNLYAGDALNNRIWKIDTSRKVWTIAGGPAQTPLFGPGSLAFDPDGNLYTVDGSKNRILKITAHAPHQPFDGTETITVFAGTGQAGFAGDGGPAAAALLNGPGGLVFDTAGRLYFSDGVNFRIRRIDRKGIITTIAGTGKASFSGDGGPALAAEIRGGALAFDSYGNLFLMDSVNNVIRVLDDTPPTIAFGTPVPPPNAHGWNNTSVTIPFTASDTGAGVASTSPLSPLVLGAEGAAVSGVVTATDRAGNQAHVTSRAARIDKEGPVISGMPKPGCSLWPPDGRMVHVATITASDVLSGVLPGSFQVTGTSNELPDAGQISITPSGSGGFDVGLAAQRSESGTGRTYTLTAQAEDYAGNRSTVTATCVVPRHHGG